MPCYELNLISVSFGGQSIELLRMIGARIGENGRVATWKGVRIDLEKGIAKGEQEAINQLKREYSSAAIKQAAKKNGWTVTKKTEREYVAVKW
jgi:hypothetical protein